MLAVTQIYPFLQQLENLPEIDRLYDGRRSSGQIQVESKCVPSNERSPVLDREVPMYISPVYRLRDTVTDI